jgi:HD-like signal output (HDOD) protein
VREAELVARDLPAPIWEVLIDIGHLTPEAFHHFVNQKSGATAINLDNYNIPPEVVDFVPEDVVKRDRAFPVDKLGKLLTLAMACPLDRMVVEEVQERTGLKVKVMSCRLDQLRQKTWEFFPERLPEDPYDDPHTKEITKEFQSLLESNEVARRIFHIDLLPLHLHAAEVIESATQGGDTDFDELMDLLVRDPSAAAPILTAANTTPFGFGVKVDSLGLALSLLSGDGVRSVLGGMEYQDYFDGEFGETYRSWWRRAQLAAEAAQRIAEATSSQRGEVARAAAVLSEIGRIALTMVVPESYLPLTSHAAGVELLDLERRLYHLDHAEAGYILARKWNLPGGICEPIRHARRQGDTMRSREVVNIVGLALLLADVHESGDRGKIGGELELLKALKLTPPQVNELLDIAEARVAAR